MTACVNKKSKRVAAVVTASLVGALSIGAPAVALATNTSIDLLATDANAFAKGTVSYKYGMEAGADFTYTGYEQGLVPSKVEVYNGDTEFPELRPQTGKEEKNKTYYYYVKIGAGVTVEVGGVKVQYKNAKGKLVDLVGTSVNATVGGTYARPIAEGTYAVVVASTDASGDFNSAVSVADTFTITGQSLDDAVLYEGTDMSDTDFAFTGEGLSDRADNFLKTVNVALDGVQLNDGDDPSAKKEVTVTVWDKGGEDRLDEKDWLVPGSTYVLKVDGAEGSRFKGQSIQREFVYSKLDLSKASIDGKVVLVSGNEKPSKDSVFDDVVAAINGFENTDIEYSASDALNQEHLNNKDIAVSFVSGPDGSISVGGEGAYTFKLTPVSTNGYVTGSAEVKVYYVDHEASIDFGNAGLDKDEDGVFDVVLNPVEPDYFDLSDIVVKSAKNGSSDDVTLKKGTDYTVTVKNSAGEEVSEDTLKTPGSYFVTVTADTELAEGETVYGTKTVKVNVAYSVVEDVDVFFSFDKENYESDEVVTPTYDGSDYFDSFSVKVTAGSKQLVEGTDYTVEVTKTQKDGKKVVVDEIVDAGIYDVAVKGVTFPGTHHFGIIVEPVTLTASNVDLANVADYENMSALKIADLLKAEDSEKREFLYIPATGSVIAPKFTYADVNKEVVELPADAVEVEYRDEDNKVVDLKDAGVYTARIVSKSEAGNYLVDYKFTNLKVSESKVFSDVHTSDWFYKPVFEAKKLSYMGGYNGTSLFGPNKSITRGEVACVLFNMANEGGNAADSTLGWTELGGYDTGFSDVNGKAFYAKAISWAKRAGVVNGYGDGTFAPDKEITREEFACMLANFAKLKGDFEDADEDAVLAEFPDGASVSDWAEEAVAWAADAEIMGNNGSLTPGKAITRAEVAAMAVNYQPKGQEDLVIPTK